MYPFRYTIVAFFLWWQSLIWAITTDFDVIVIGSSPISLLNALYEHHIGHRVMILEENEICGGAWKYIDVCGIAHVDLGCHQIGTDTTVREFLEKYVGCTLVALDNPHIPYGTNSKDDTNGFYPSQGCYELIKNLTALIAATDITLRLNTKLESVYIDTDRQIVEFKTRNGKYTTSKVVITQASAFHIENITNPYRAQNIRYSTKSRYFHLYLLVEDPTPWCCSYRHGILPGVSRFMNLTPFVGLDGSGMQLFVLQTYSEIDFNKQDIYLEQLKKNHILADNARLLQVESVIYEQNLQYPHIAHQLPKEMQTFFEVLNTSHIQNIVSYVPKWKDVFKPYEEALLESAAKM